MIGRLAEAYKPLQTSAATEWRPSEALNGLTVDSKQPADTEEPSHFVTIALAAPSGGVEIESGCGEYYLRPYLVDEHATGMFAAELVARTLGSADNLSSATAVTGKVTFGVKKDVHPSAARDGLTRNVNRSKRQLWAKGGLPRP